jgi:hypothetical protein
MYVHPPNDDDDDPGSARVLKLHGSASWRRDGEFVRATEDPLFALSCPDSELAIASPGPAKQELTKMIDNIWSKAMQAINTAECVVFMGYRFPPSDSRAKKKLLEALTANRAMYLPVHIVLGPDARDSNVLRLKEMLRFALRDRAEYTKTGDDRPPTKGSDKWFQLAVHPLWAEDFLTLAHRGILTEPYWRRTPTAAT